MGTKRSPIRRRRIGSNAEYEAWRETFNVGNDGFGDLQEFGIFDPCNQIIPMAEMATARASFQEIKRDAWRRFGARFMAEWTPTQAHEFPEAYLEFGAP